MLRKNYEYQIHNLKFDSKPSRADQILQFLSRFGQEGWRVVSLDVAPRPAYNEHELQVLFEREVPET